MNVLAWIGLIAFLAQVFILIGENGRKSGWPSLSAALVSTSAFVVLAIKVLVS